MKFSELINERYRESAVIERAVRYLLDAIDWSDGGGETVMYELGYDNVEKLPGKRKLESEIRRWAIDKCKDFEDTLEWMFHENGGNLEVYRVINAPVNWKPDPNRHPGIYWSWDIDAADAHWSEGNGIDWLLTATIHKRDVEWSTTIALNCDPSLGENEKEIRIKEGTPIQFTYRKKQ